MRTDRTVFVIRIRGSTKDEEFDSEIRCPEVAWLKNYQARAQCQYLKGTMLLFVLNKNEVMLE